MLLDEQIKEVEFITQDGLRLHSFYFPYSEEAPMVIYFHGNAGNALHRLNPARRLAETGANVLLVGYRGYGRSQGRPSEKGLYLDAQAAINYVVEDLGFKKEDVFLLGQSLGSAIAIDAAQHQKLGGLILITPFPSGYAVMEERGLGWLSLFVRGSPFDSAAKLPHLKTPALFVIAEHDKTITPAMSRTLFNAYPSQDKSLMIIPGAGHNDIFSISGPQIWSRLAAFVHSSFKKEM